MSSYGLCVTRLVVSDKVNHKSTNNRSNMSIISKIFALTLLFAGISTSVRAQMFSVDDQADRVVRPTTNSLMIGIAPVDFSLRGIDLDGIIRLDYTDVMYRAMLESPTLIIHAAYGVNLGSDDQITAFNLGAIVTNRIALNRGRRTMLYLPLRLQTDWRTVRNTGEGSSNDEFQQSSVMAGTGFGGIIRTGTKSTLDLSVNGNYGYSVRSFGADGGQTYLLEGKVRYLVNNISTNLGLSFGYDYSFQDYYIGGEAFDYRFKGHSILVGIRF